MPIYSPATLQVRNALAPFISQLLEQDPYQKVLVGVSGGSDSMALASALLECKQTLDVIPVVVDHGLQMSSAEIAELTKVRLAKMGYADIFVGKADIQITDGLEASARRGRYRIFNQALETFGAQVMFLAHHKNDQAETVLLGLLRGSGSRSIEGMRPEQGAFRRPLLSLETSTLKKYCQENSIEFWEDPMNNDERFTRIKVRDKALPFLVDELGNGIISGLVNSASQFQRDNDYFAIQRDELLDQISKWQSSDKEIHEKNHHKVGKAAWRCDLAILRAAHPAIRTRALREIVIACGAPAEKLTFEHFESLERLLTSTTHHGPTYLPGGLWARIEGNLLLVEGSDRQ
jgi:tRNA(Ile)-lysidine synthase